MDDRREPCEAGRESTAEVREVDVARGPVLEADADDVRSPHRGLDASAKRLDPPQRLMPASAIPVLRQLCLVVCGPLPDEPQRTWRKLTRGNLDGLDRERCLVVAAARMEVRGGVPAM